MVLNESTGSLETRSPRGRLCLGRPTPAKSSFRLAEDAIALTPMKLFNTLMSKIFGRASTAAPAPAGGAPAPSTGAQTASQNPASTATAPPRSAATPGAAATPAASGTPAPASVDVNAVLNEMASKNSERLDWKKSIVDLMKLVGMDSSLSNRKELATELGYTGDKNDSATMNVWLHKAVLKKLAENGGKVPQNLLD